MATVRHGRHSPMGVRRSAARVLTLVLLLALLALSGYSQAGASGSAGADADRWIARDEVTGGQRLLVKFRADATAAQRGAAHRAAGAVLRGHIRALGTDIVALPASANARTALERYRAHRLVEYAEPDFVAAAFATPNDPFFANQWHLSRIGAAAAWDVATGSANVTVAIVDTGVLATHPDLAGRVVAGYDFVNNDADPTDDQGHGTLVAGVVGAVANNAQGVAGINWDVRILAVKVLGSDGRGAYSAIAQGITYAVDNGARVVNLSLGGTSDSLTLKAAVDYARSKGALVFAAAGNSASVVAYPAAYDSAVAVSAIDAADGLASFSNFGPEIDLAAPGVSVYTTTRSGYGSASGTSLSCPIAAGVAALVWGARADWSAEQVLERLEATADDLGPAGSDVYFGYGCVNAGGALRDLAGRAPEPVGDLVPPTVHIANPGDGAVVSGTVGIAVEATDASGVAGVEVYVDGTLLGRDATAPYGASWDSRTSANGVHTIMARAFDANGNYADHVISVVVENDTRTQVVFKGAVGGRSPAVATHSVTASGPGLLEATLAWGGKAQLRLELYDAGGTLLAVATGPSPAVIRYQLPAAGTYRLVVRVVSGKASYTLTALVP